MRGHPSKQEHVPADPPYTPHPYSALVRPPCRLADAPAPLQPAHQAPSACICLREPCLVSPHPRPPTAPPVARPPPCPTTTCSRYYRNLEADGVPTEAVEVTRDIRCAMRVICAMHVMCVRVCLCVRVWVCVRVMCVCVRAHMRARGLCVRGLLLACHGSDLSACSCLGPHAAAAGSHTHGLVHALVPRRPRPGAAGATACGCAPPRQPRFPRAAQHVCSPAALVHDKAVCSQDNPQTPTTPHPTGP